MTLFINHKTTARMRRSIKIRRKMKELNVIRLVVHRTSRHIYAQIISSSLSKVIVVASTLEKNISKKLKYTGNKEAAETIGSIIGKRALEKGIHKISFDRSGFKYHGRIQALAESARKAGLQF